MVEYSTDWNTILDREVRNEIEKSFTSLATVYFHFQFIWQEILIFAPTLMNY